MRRHLSPHVTVPVPCGDSQEPFGLEFDIGGGKKLLARAPDAEEQAKWLKVIGDFFSR